MTVSPAVRPSASEGWADGLVPDPVDDDVDDVDDEDGDDDPPHAVSSSTSDPSPAATAQPLLRIALSIQNVPWDLTRPDTPESYQTVEPAGGYLAAT
jgi:hypothetical protein